ncbi:MAG: hypothetical protein ABEJ26_04295 [Halosimplex sp.]
MTPRRHALLAATAVLAALSLAAPLPVAPAGAAPPPEEVCGVCGDALESAAGDAGLALTVEHSAATIRVDGSGTGRWLARVRISDGAADRLADNASLRRHVVRESLDGRTVVDDPRDLRTRVEDGSLVVAFEVPGVAHRSVGGAVLVDLLDRRTRRAGFRVAADELRIAGPNGTAATRAPPSGTVEDGSVVFRSEGPRAGLWGDTRLAFAPTDGPVARGLTTVGFVAFGVEIADSGVLFLGVVPALALGGALLALRRWGDEVPSVDPVTLATAVSGGGAVAAGLAALSLAGLGFLDPAVAETVAVFTALYALVGGCALVVDRPSPLACRFAPARLFEGSLRSPSPRVALVWALGAAAAVALVASPVSIVAFQTALLSVPAVLWFPLGRASGRDRAVSGVVAAATVLAPFGAAVLFQPSISPVYGLIGSILTTIPWTCATALFGVPLYLLGRALDDERDPTVGDARADRASAD